MPPFGLSSGSPIRLRRPSSLHNRSRHLDRRDCAELPVPLLHLRDGDRGVGDFAHQGSVFGDEVVHGADSLLDFHVTLSISLLIYLYFPPIFMFLFNFHLFFCICIWVDIRFMVARVGIIITLFCTDYL